MNLSVHDLVSLLILANLIPEDARLLVEAIIESWLNYDPRAEIEPGISVDPRWFRVVTDSVSFSEMVHQVYSSCGLSYQDAENFLETVTDNLLV